MTLAELVAELLGPDPLVAVELHDGSVLGPAEAPARIVFRSPAVLRRLLTAPGELGFGRAYVAGELDVEGDVYAALELQERLAATSLSPRQWLEAARLVGRGGLRPPPPPPPAVFVMKGTDEPSR
jgi:cyclopropane-fatty-acyl-phospholipid synthase